MRKYEFMASLAYSEMAPDKVCESLAKIGYDGVGWTMSHYNPRTKSKDQMKQLVDAPAKHGLGVGEIVVQQDLIILDKAKYDDNVNLVLECIEAAGQLGIDVVNLFTGPAPWMPDTPRIGADITEGAAWDLLLAAFDKFVPAAEKNNVQLAVEGVWLMLCHDYYSTLPLIDHFDSPNLGVNLDVSHDVLAGNMDVAWIAKQWAKKDRIKHMHIKDAVGIQRMGKFIFPLIGEGNVDWAALKAALDEIGYDGFMSVEFESFTYHNQILKGDTEQAAKISMDAINMLLR